MVERGHAPRSCTIIRYTVPIDGMVKDIGTLENIYMPNVIII